jgi:hypothetical protein
MLFWQRLYSKCFITLSLRAALRVSSSGLIEPRALIWRFRLGLSGCWTESSLSRALSSPSQALSIENVLVFLLRSERVLMFIIGSLFTRESWPLSFLQDRRAREAASMRADMVGRGRKGRARQASSSCRAARHDGVGCRGGGVACAVPVDGKPLRPFCPCVYH